MCGKETQLPLRMMNRIRIGKLCELASKSKEREEFEVREGRLVAVAWESESESHG